MIGIVVATKSEWETLLKIYNIDDSNLEKYPYGEYYRTIFNNKDVVYFRSGIRKVNISGALQYMIDKFSLEKIVLLGTCTAVSDEYDYLDVIVPSKVIDYDHVIRELSFNINENSCFELENDDIKLPYFDGTIGSSDKALILWKDLTYLASVGIDASDMESSAVCKICKINNVIPVIIKGISDRPMKNEDGFNEQNEVYEENTPIVMKKIIEDYLPEVI